MSVTAFVCPLSSAFLPVQYNNVHFVPCRPYHEWRRRLRLLGQNSSNKVLRRILILNQSVSTSLTSDESHTEDTVQQKQLNKDELSAARSTVKVTRYLFSHAQSHSNDDESASSISVWDLLVYCSVKGLKLSAGTNIWDRESLERIASAYCQREKEVRLGSTEFSIRELHDICNAEGDATYKDPQSGYTVFSSFAHLKRGYCCGLQKNDDDDDGGDKKEKTYNRTHRCRHCPYNDLGEVPSTSMRALRDRLHVVEYIRDAILKQWTINEHEKDEGYEVQENEIQPSVPIIDKDNMARLRKKLVKRVIIEKPLRQEGSCSVCHGEQMVTCPRCNGFTWVFSPKVQECPRCKGEGMHPCIQCTPYRPPPSTSIYNS